MKMARGGWIHVVAAAAVPGGVAGACFQVGWVVPGLAALLVGALLVAFMAYFFRDPERPVVKDAGVVVSGADGWVRCVEPMPAHRDLGCDAVRVSTYLTPWDVHVNRVPVAGVVKGLRYTPGQHILTRNEASSERNEHSTILIEGERLRCVVRQIVGPIVRRVVYWLRMEQHVQAGERLGIMKFGSRLDVVLPAAEVEVVVRKGDRVFAGVTVIARIRKGGV